VLWVCDPMHGNTRLNRHGQKTRIVTDIVAEIEQVVAGLGACGIRPAGLHLETTPDAVRECVDSVSDLDAFLDPYGSACDPRLNSDQAGTVVGAALAAGWGR